jgi:hypothetical protein
MKLTENYSWRNSKREFTIAEAIENSCVSHSDGAIERLSDVTDNVVRKLAALIELLHENGRLTDDNVLSLLSGFKKAEDRK